MKKLREEYFREQTENKSKVDLIYLINEKQEEIERLYSVLGERNEEIDRLRNEMKEQI